MAPSRPLGTDGLTVSAIGFGTLALADAYGPADEAESIATVQAAVDMGVTFFDTADVYGPFTAERILGRALRGRREAAVVATKFGNECTADGTWLGVNGRPEYVARACDASLARLGCDVIDLYYLHRVDPTVPIEETWAAMAALVEAGKVRHLGLSEAGPATLRRAQAVHPVTALQSEYSLFSRDVEGPVLDTARELGIGFVAYCPLSRGLLAGAIPPDARFDGADNRSHLPRFSPAHLPANVRRAEAVAAVARRIGVTPAQVALAWLLSRGGDVVPIPGMADRRLLAENAAAVDVRLTADDLAALDALPALQGDRFGPEMMATIDR